MPSLAVTHVEVYVFRRAARGVQFLTLRRAAGRKLPGIWQPVTGKIQLLETIAEAAWREVQEETGIRARRMWRLERTSIHIDARGRSLVVLPLLAAEVGGRDAVRLSKEHSEWRFVSAAVAAKLYLWDSQREGLDAVRRQVLPGGARARALELVTAGVARGTHRRRA
jgi:8-oxo-dGTP pyrophosphatase MutT (NUDIX family)